MKLFNGIGRAGRGLFRRNRHTGRVEDGKKVLAERKVSADSAEDDQDNPVTEDYGIWEEIDNLRFNFFLGGWVTRRLREISTVKQQQDRGELAKKKKAEQEGREYKSPLQLELEEAARKREEKKKLKEERRRQKEAKRRG